MPDTHIDPTRYHHVIQQELAELHCRAGEPVPIRPLMSRLMNQLQPRELAAVLDDMADHGLFTRDGQDSLIIAEAACPSPSAADIRAILLGVVASTNPRPGDAVSPQVFMARVSVRLRAAEMHAGLDALVAEGALTFNGRSHILTDAGLHLLD